jgi:hypothetical protein
MKTIAPRFLAIAAMTVSIMPAAAEKTSDFPVKSTSFVPHAQTNHHVYGSPISSPVVVRAKSPHRKTMAKKPQTRS